MLPTVTLVFRNSFGAKGLRQSKKSCKLHWMNASQLKTELESMARRLAAIAAQLESSESHVNDKPVDFLVAQDSDQDCRRCGKSIPKEIEPIRENHPACYRTTMREIARGDYSEDDAIAAELLLPARRPGRKPKAKQPTESDLVQEAMRHRQEREAGAPKLKALLPPDSE
jgi:hypothetical protein